jgi:hypothetical protein
MMKENYVKVEGSNYLYKDPSSGVIINTDKSEIAAARKRKESTRDRKTREESFQQEFSSMKAEISELKNLIKELVGK